MKKISLFLLSVIATICFSQTTITQDDLLNTLKPSLENALTFKKYKEVYARSANIGEVIKTYTKDGLETQNIAKQGDYVVKNITDAKEMYILTETKFNARYIFKSKLDDVWGIYSPIGKIKVLQVNDELLKKLNISDDTFYIMASWGEKMIVKKNDFLVSPLSINEVYRIANHEFFETYTLDK